MTQKQNTTGELTIIKLIQENILQIFRRRNRQRVYLDYPEPSADIVQFKSLFIRHLDCGSCNGCEMELNALNNPVYDIGQYGIQFESSPRHADVLCMTGPYTRNLDEAARLTMDAMPEPCIITIGDCAQDGDVFRNSYAIQEKPKAIEEQIACHVPGCPPEPQDILEALLKFMAD
jgi:Ni,Fe-hydrogenase III small subunit